MQENKYIKVASHRQVKHCQMKNCENNKNFFITWNIIPYHAKFKNSSSMTHDNVSDKTTMFTSYNKNKKHVKIFEKCKAMQK